MNGGRDDRTKQSTRAAEDSERSDVSGAQPAPMAVPHRLGWRGVWWFACGVAGTLAIVWFIIFSRGEIGSKAEWFFGAVVFCVVMVTMWQTLNIQRQANQHAAEAAERLCTELVAAEERAARELAMTQAFAQGRNASAGEGVPRRDGGSTGAGSRRARPPDQSAAEAGDGRGVARGQRTYPNAPTYGTRAPVPCGSRTATSGSRR
jgi:hypothetical protein